MIRLGIATSLVLLAGGVSAEQGRLPAVNPAHAAMVCETGATNAYFADAAEACWPAYYRAVQNNEFQEAMQHVAAGCLKYRRADFCTLASRLNASIPVNVSNLRHAFEDAAASIASAEIEDAETGRALAEAVRNGRFSTASGSVDGRVPTSSGE